MPKHIVKYLMIVLLFLQTVRTIGQTVVEQNGALQTIGRYLCNSYGDRFVRERVLPNLIELLKLR